MLFINSIRERLTIISLSGDEYVDALQTSSKRIILGGAIYDALLAHCAIKANADVIYSWNAKHYRLCGPAVTERLQQP